MKTPFVMEIPQRLEICANRPIDAYQVLGFAGWLVGFYVIAYITRIWAIFTSVASVMFAIVGIGAVIKFVHPVDPNKEYYVELKDDCIVLSLPYQENVITILWEAVERTYKRGKRFQSIELKYREPDKENSSFITFDIDYFVTPVDKEGLYQLISYKVGPNKASWEDKLYF